jgi:hypothetical protein
MTTYTLDPTGVMPANLITDEVISLTPQFIANFPFVLLSLGPFYGNGINVKYISPLGVTVQLTRGVDYHCVFIFAGATSSPDNPVYGGLSFISRLNPGSLLITYHALGGNWTCSYTDVKAFLDTHAFNPDVSYLQYVPLNRVFAPSSVQEIVLNTFANIITAQSELPSIAMSIGLSYNGNQVTTNTQEMIESILVFNNIQTLANQVEAAKEATIAAANLALDTIGSGAGADFSALYTAAKT